MQPHEPQTDRGTLQRWTFLILLLGIGYLFWIVARPLWVPIFLGALIAIGMHPVHKAFVHTLKNKRREAISAGLITGGVLAVGGLLMALFSFIVLRQILAMVRTFAQESKHKTPMQLMGPGINDLLVSFGENPAHLQKKVIEAASTIAGNMGDDATHLLTASFGIVLIIIFTTITSYYLLRNGERFTSWFVAILPLPDGEVWELVRNFRDVARVMLLGTGVTSFYQGTAATIGYWVAGVPHPLVFGAATGFASILPALGSTIIWAPVVIYLFAKGYAVSGGLLFLYCALVVVGIADYVLRPQLLGNKVKMNDLVIFIALFGGIEAFGLLGTILGPIIAALLVAMLRIYQRDYRPRGPRAVPTPAPVDDHVAAGQS